jgi:hypothetical protein
VDGRRLNLPTCVCVRTSAMPALHHRAANTGIISKQDLPAVLHPVAPISPRPLPIISTHASRTLNVAIPHTLHEYGC